MVRDVLDDQARYRLLTLLKENPKLTQRELAELLDISLGKTNHCLKALSNKGLIKVQNFRNSRNKTAYLYTLTPAGLKDKIRVTRRFLARKLQEHAQLGNEIEQLKCEMASDKSETAVSALENH